MKEKQIFKQNVKLDKFNKKWVSSDDSYNQTDELVDESLKRQFENDYNNLNMSVSRSERKYYSNEIMVYQ